MLGAVPLLLSQILISEGVAPLYLFGDPKIHFYIPIRLVWQRSVIVKQRWVEILIVYS